MESKKNRASLWLNAARLRTLPLAASAVLTAGALVEEKNEIFWLLFMLALVTCLLLQVLSNFANDYGDFVKGTDNKDRIGPQRTLQSGAITERDMKIAIVICALAAFISGLVLVWYSLARSGFLNESLVWIALGLLAIAAAIKYTVGKKPYGYSGLGDVVVFLFFGLVGVGGTYYLISAQWEHIILVPAAAIGLFSTSVLNLNNMRDQVNDKKSGKITVVVRLGFNGAKVYQLLILLAGWTCIFIYFIASNAAPVSWLCFIILPIHLIHIVKVIRTYDPAKLDVELKKIALSTFFLSLLLFITS